MTFLKKTMRKLKLLLSIFVLSIFLKTMKSLQCVNMFHPVSNEELALNQSQTMIRKASALPMRKQQ